MRWEALFADLEAEFAAAEGVEADAELRDRVRRELTSVRLVDRLTAARGAALSVHVRGAALRGRLVDCGANWLLLAESPAREALVPLAAVAAITGLSRWSAVAGSEGRVGARLDLAYALRGIARDRSAVAVSVSDSSVCAGTIDRVGADFLEVAEHPVGESRRTESVTGVRTVPTSAILVVRSG